MKRITLVGFGLLASSIASAVKELESSTVIRAVSSKATLKKASDLNLAHEFFEYEDVENWSRDSDIILLCGPILHILKTLESLKNLSWIENLDKNNREILVSDIGSTKVEICKSGKALPPPFYFVGGHPMAGSEKRGCEHNDPSLFENAYWFVCPEEGTEESTYKKLLTLIKFLGSEPVVFPASHHDSTMAWVSHMPQMLSSTLAASLPVRMLKNGYQHYAGRAFRDMTRIAASSWGMWHDIALTNRDETVLALEELSEGISKTILAMKNLKVIDGIHTLESDDHSKELEEIFKSGNEGRKSLFKKGRNSSTFFEITVQLKDKPGALLSVLQPLAEEGINVRDIELMKVRENVAGTLLLAFKTEEEASKAIKLLRYLEYQVNGR